MDAATNQAVVTAASSSVDELPPLGARVVADALGSDGEETYRGVYEPNIHADYVVQSDESTYYRVRVHAGEHADATGYRYTGAFGDDVTPPPDRRDVVDFTDLPRSDRDSFLGALETRVGRLHEANGGQFSVVFASPDRRTREQSVFIPSTDPRYVRLNGQLSRVEFAEKRPVEVVTYTITVERVAESADAFAGLALETRGVVLDDLSADQRDIVERAIDGEYSACEPYSDAFRGLLDRLSVDEHRFASFARYADDWYLADVSRWVT